MLKLVKPSVLSNGSIACTQKSKSGFFSKAMRAAMHLNKRRASGPLLDDGRPSNKLDRATALGIPIV